MKRLIITGLGLREYIVSAVIAMEKFGDATLDFSSQGFLPTYLGRLVSAGKCGYGRIDILGVGLTSNVAALSEALAALGSAGARVHWYSAGYDVPAGLSDAAARALEAHVTNDGTPLDAFVANCYGVTPISVSDIQPAQMKDYIEFYRAAEWHFTNTRMTRPLIDLVGYIVAGKSSERWSDEDLRLREAFRLYGERDFVGSGQAIRALRQRVSKVAASFARRILVTGESGTGKETVALQIHVQSGTKLRRAAARRHGGDAGGGETFVAFNCATVAGELLEGRLFGYNKGAFTGANEDHPGIFEQADGGTVFLDEIGELPLKMQGVLLRVLQDGRVQRLGSAEEIPVNVRVIAATHRDLPKMVRDGKFREDLYYRLGQVELHVPSLRERKEDIQTLAKNFWKRLLDRVGMARGVNQLTPSQLAALESYAFPGNVRELQNILERALIFGADSIPEIIAESAARAEGMAKSAQGDYPDNLDEAMALHVRRVRATSRTLADAAHRLGVTANTVRRYLQR